jgi:hypothetical protein
MDMDATQPALSPPGLIFKDLICTRRAEGILACLYISIGIPES